MLNEYQLFGSEFGSAFGSDSRDVRGSMVGSVRQLKSGRFQARYTYRGVKVSKAFQFQGQAQTFIDRETELIHKGIWTPPAEREKQNQRATETVGQYWEHYKSTRKWTPGTRETYESVWKDRIKGDLSNMALVEVKKTDVLQWWYSTIQAHPTTDKRNFEAHMLIKAIFSQAVREERLDRSPVTLQVPRPKPKPRYIPTLDELRRVVAELPEHLRMPALLLANGCRIAEVSALTRSDVNIVPTVGGMKQLTISISKQAERKRGKWEVRQYTKSTTSTRIVLLPPVLIPAIEKHLQTFVKPEDDAVLCPNKDGEGQDRRRFNTALKAACKRAGVQEFTSHSLRHFAGTEYQRRGASIRETQALLGHSTAEMSLHYSHVAKGREAELAVNMDETFKDVIG